MKADITRRTFRPELHYAATIQQQGRVPIDADWNEQVEIQQHHDEVETIDVVGQVGFPNGDSFKVEALGSDLRVYPGSGYVDGILCELDAGTVPVTVNSASQVTPTTWTVDEQTLREDEYVQLTGATTKVYRITSMDSTTLMLTLDVGSDNLTTLFGSTPTVLSRVVTYFMQPEWLAPDVPAQTGIYLAYLDVWRRHVTALEDSDIREVALGGPDTCTRMRTTWQVKLNLVGAISDTITCEQASFPVQPVRGALSARAQKPSDEQTPCILPPTARYRSLENQLYRVEVHQGGDLGVTPFPTFKFSIDNGTVVTPWLSGSQELQVGSTGKDSVLRFSAGDWVELVDDAHELAGAPGALAKIASVSAPDTITLETPVDPASYPLHPRVRRWDQDSTTGELTLEQPSTNDGYVALGDSGVEVRFEPGRYTTGDYWLIPARTITTDVEWPKSELGTPLPRARHGIDHHFARLALVSWDGSQFKVLNDCRPQFPPLTDIHADDVKVDGSYCDFPPSVKTVQDAISQLCKQKENACCELVIVPGDDVQWMIDDAIAKAVKRNVKGLHVCFAAGKHELAKTIVIKPPTSGWDLTVSGCGLAAHVAATKLGTALQIDGWSTATVVDLSIEAGVPSMKSESGLPLKGSKLSAALHFTNCDRSVAERLSVRCGSADSRVTSCIRATNTPTSQTEARVHHCELHVGTNQVGITMVDVDRPTITSNRLLTRVLTVQDVAAVGASKAFRAELKSLMMSDLRIGKAASLTVPTAADEARNHLTINNVKIAFTSEKVLAGAWSQFVAAGGTSKFVAVRSTQRLVDAVRRDRLRQPSVKPAPAPGTATPARTPVMDVRAATIGAATSGTSASDTAATIGTFSVPNNLAARVRMEMEQLLTKMLNKVLAPSASKQDLEKQGLGIFYDWANKMKAAYLPGMLSAIAVAGSAASDVRIVDNTITNARYGIRVALSSSDKVIRSVVRARIANNTIAMRIPTGKTGSSYGIFVGSCKSLGIENNHVRRSSGTTKSTAINVRGQLGAMMRGEGNHSIGTTVGIDIHPTNDPIPKNVLWILSQNVAENTTTAIHAPDVEKIHNAP